MLIQNPPDPSVLSQLLYYEAETGKLFWRQRTPDMFHDGDRSAEHTCSNWNARYAGNEAFAGIDKDGYRQGKLFNKRYRAHRVIWAMQTGEWSAEDIDHIDGNPANNKLANLRAVSHLENQRNKKRYKNNTTGAAGVVNRNGRWEANITIKGKRVYLGTFDDFSEALASRKEADLRIGYHKNHGRG